MHLTHQGVISHPRLTQLMNWLLLSVSWPVGKLTCRWVDSCSQWVEFTLIGELTSCVGKFALQQVDMSTSCQWTIAADASELIGDFIKTWHITYCL